MPPPCRMLSHSPPCKHRFWSFCKKCCRNPVFRQVGHDRFDRQLLLRAYYEPHEVPFIIVCMGVHGLRRSMGAGYGPVFPGQWGQLQAVSGGPASAGSQTPAAALGRQGHSRAVRTHFGSVSVQDFLSGTDEVHCFRIEIFSGGAPREGGSGRDVCR